MRILIVDDSMAARTILRDALAGRGQSDMAENGEKAVALFAQSLEENAPYDLVLMDVMMPGMSGLEAAELIRDMQDHAGIDPEDRACMVMITCLDDPATMVGAQYDSGADYYLPKPFTFGQLEEALICLELADSPLDEE